MMMMMMTTTTTTITKPSLRDKHINNQPLVLKIESEADKNNVLEFPVGHDVGEKKCSRAEWMMKETKKQQLEI